MSEKSHAQAAPAKTASVRPATVKHSPARAHAPSSSRGGILQRKCACGSSGGDGKCSKCKNEEGLLQRRAAHHYNGPATIPPVVHNVLGSPGRPLDATARSYMEPRFGHDFSHVRIHTDAQAAESARAVDARAYTVGAHIVFDHGEYSPHSFEGKRLLAHELAHTVQQHGIQRSGRHMELGDAPQYVNLEREADALAARVMSSSAPSPGASLNVTQRPLQPVVSLAARGGAKRKWATVNPAITAVGASMANSVQILRQAQFDKNTYIFEIDRFYLPSLKGPVKKYWESAVRAGTLETFVDFSGSSARVGLMQGRNPTAMLRASWFRRVGWTGRNAAQKWCESGGPPPGVNRLPSNNPIVQTSAGTVECQFDHIVDLQLGGVNTPSNLQALDGPANEQAGREIWDNQVYALAQAIRNTMPAPQPHTIGLHFNSVVVTGTEVTCGSCPAPGTATSCSQVECCALSKSAPANTACGTSATSTAATPATVPPGTEPYPIRAGSVTSVIYAPIGQTTVDLWTTNPANRVAAEIIPGLLLLVLHRGENIEEAGDRGKTSKVSTDIIEACMEGVNCAVQRAASRTQTRIPLSFRGAGIVYFGVEPLQGKQQERRIRLDAKSRSFEFLYPYLSKGTMKLEVDEVMGMVGKGKLTPSVPLLKNAPINILMAGGDIVASMEIPKEKLKLPIPYFRATRASLGLSLSPEFDPRGEFAFEVGSGKRPALEGLLRAGKDENGLVLTGDINANLPGVDKATGKLEYRNSVWSGGIDIGKDNFKISFIEQANLHVGFTGDKIEITGGVSLVLPGGQTVDLDVKRRGPNWVYTGRGQFKVPGLKPVTLTIVYDGQHIIASGKTGFTVAGLDGDMTVNYEDGRFSGTGTLNVKKKRAEGKIKVNMSPRYKFSGEGNVTYKFSENLIGSAGIILDEDGSVRLKGAIVVPKPVPLFRRFGDKKTLWEPPPLKIPIPVASIGPVGLKVVISGGLGLHYWIGPGQLENIRLEVAFSPLEDDPDYDITAGAALRVPAEAGVWARVKAGLAIDAGIASVSGNIIVTGKATLRGGAGAEVLVRYTKQRFSLDGKVVIDVGLVLGLDLDASVEAEAGVGPFTVGVSKVWNLASYSYDTGLKAGLKAPISYSSDEGFKPPSIDNIEWITPKLDAGDVLDKTFSGANPGKET